MCRMTSRIPPSQWVETGVEARVELLKECITSLKSSAEEYAGLQIAQKGSYGEGSGAAVSEVAMLIIACQSHLSSLSSNFCDPVQGVRKLPSGHTAVEVFPQLPLDTLVRA